VTFISEQEVCGDLIFATPIPIEERFERYSSGGPGVVEVNT
jgi:hypothetical protein